MKAILEGILFVVGDEGVSVSKLCDILETNEEEVNKYLEELKNDYLKDDRGIKIEVLGNNLKLTTKSEHRKYYEKLLEEDDGKFLTQAALETLAIIAYNQPITRVELDEIRGISCSHMVRKLVSRNFIKEVGRSELPGRPILYGVTDEFLDYFGLSSIDELPKVENVLEDDSQIDLFESKYTE